VNDQFYEVQFGGPPIQVEVGGVPCPAQLAGPLPSVQFAPLSRNFCLGSVLLFVDAKTRFPVYLDGKPQRFDISGRPVVIRLVDRLRIVLLNEVPVPLVFGGPPVAINFMNSQHFLRYVDYIPDN